MRGIIFDKDGTLFDFNATWGTWARQMILAETQGDTGRAGLLADVLGFDMDGGAFRPGSVVIAEPVDIVADAILTVISDEKPALIARMNAAAARVPQVPATDLNTFFATLRSSGFRTGVVTNDAEEAAHAHLHAEGVRERIDFLAGYDSGHGTKPAPGPLLAFCDATGCVPADCVMVGDSLHDLIAGRAAGMRTVGVLTGPAPAEELSPQADAVLSSIAELPAWLGTV